MLKVKKGDTLIEVLLAVGIFSLIAISVVAVMNGGTSEAQLSLETTLTREEIDSQAEALRFVHEAYINDRETKNNEVSSNALWQTIVKNAITLDPTKDNSNITNYAPSVCPNFRNKTDVDSVIYDHAFVLNTRNLNAEPIKNSSGTIVGHPAYIAAKDSSHKLIPTTTYPRLVFGNSEGSLVEGDSRDLSLGTTNYVGRSDVLQAAEGIYVIAVADSNTTAIINAEGGRNDIAFYDFYIRSCWYGTNSDTPSSISTVIRLHNPDSVKLSDLGNTTHVTYNNNCPGGDCRGVATPNPDIGRKVAVPNLPDIGETNSYRFVAWCTGEVSGTNCNGRKYYPGEIVVGNRPNVINEVNLKGIWAPLYTLSFYDTNHSTLMCRTKSTAANITLNCNKDPTNPDPSKQVFQGWSPDDREPFLKNGNTASVPNTGDRNLNLYPSWRVVITFNGNEWTKSSSGQSESNCTIFNIRNSINENAAAETYTDVTPNNCMYCTRGRCRIRCVRFNASGSCLSESSTSYSTCTGTTWNNNPDNCIQKNSSGICTKRCLRFNTSTNACTQSVDVSGSTTITNQGNYTPIKKGQTYGSYNVAPMDGYAVTNGGQHIEALNEGIINLQGYCRQSANEGVYYEMGKDDTFELVAKMNTEGMRTHPGGYVTVGIGPLSAQINNGYISSKCNGSSGSNFNFSSNSQISIKINKYGSEYSLAVNGTTLKTCNVPNYTDANNKVRVNYYMYHSSHSCSELFNVQLFDISMKRVIKE